MFSTEGTTHAPLQGRLQTSRLSPSVVPLPPPHTPTHETTDCPPPLPGVAWSCLHSWSRPHLGEAQREQNICPLCMARMTTVPVHKHGCKKKDTSLCPLKQFNSSEALSYQAGQKFDLGNYGTPPQTCAKVQGASAWLPLTHMVPWCELDKGAHSGGDTD